MFTLKIKKILCKEKFIGAMSGLVILEYSEMIFNK